jgi:hypothetical protein
MFLLGLAFLLQLLLHLPSLQKALSLLLEGLVIELKLLAHELPRKDIKFGVDFKLLALYQVPFGKYFVDCVLPVLLIKPFVL